MEKYFEKSPCVKFGWIDDGKIVYVRKKAYDTYKKAIEAAKVLNSSQFQITKEVAYKCFKCFKWHIGRNEKSLSQKDTKHYKRLFTFINT